jgi:hypothetical protein
MKKTLERLEQLLDEKDSKIEELQRELDELKDEEDKNWGWARHRTLKENPEGLPVPRLEIRWHKLSDDGYLARWDYALIYKHFLGHILFIPLGQTSIQGGRGEPPIYNGDEIQLPFRDGPHICHDAMHLNIPAFAICEGRIWILSMDEDGTCRQTPFTSLGKTSKKA